MASNDDILKALGVGTNAEDTKKPAEPKPKATAKKTAPRRKQTKDLAIMKRETYSRRVELLFKQSTYDKVTATAEEYGISVNALINAIVEDYIK